MLHKAIVMIQSIVILEHPIVNSVREVHKRLQKITKQLNTAFSY